MGDTGADVTRPTTTERPLTEEERADLMARAAKARSEARQAFVRTGGASVVICGMLAAITTVASDAPNVVILGFWATLACVFTVWVGGPWRKLMRGQVMALDDALGTGRARTVRIQSAHVVEFEEEEDEGACYAFEYGLDASIFVVGQEFYEDVDFPNADFSIVEILGASGYPIDTVVKTHGQKLVPDRVIAAQIKHRLEIPQHLEIVRAPLDRVEQSLRPYSQRDT
jgi:hypothetical protein